MIQDFISNHLAKAKYELIDNGKRFYGEVRGLRGVWATGKTLEECRQNLLTALEGWLILRLRRNLPIPNFKFPHSKIKFSPRSYV